MFFTIVAAFAEFERDRIAERITDTKASEKEKGRYLGGSRPFGYQVGDGGYLLPNADEQPVVRRILELRQQGLSLRAIADEVSTDGLRLSHMAVKRVIRDAELREQ